MNYKTTYKKIIVAAVFFLGICLRFYNLGQNPVSLNWDEVSVGYNAYSILKTAKDEFGRFLPVSFQSYNDYKMPLYIYFTVPSVFLFGLNEFSVRFPSAFFGSLTLLVFYFLTGEVFKKLGKKGSFNVQLVSLLLLALNPWHLQFSRVAFEATLALFWIISGLFLLLKARQKNFWLIFAGISFVLSIYSYHSAVIFSPLIAGIVFFLYGKKFIKAKKYVVFTLITCLLMLWPLLNFMLSGPGLTRFRGTSALSEVDVKFWSIEKINQDDGLVFFPEFASKLLHNRRIYYAKQFLNGYLSHYSLNFLFLPDKSDKHHAPQVGYFYFLELPFLLFGLFKIFDWKIAKKTKIFIFAAFLLAALPSAPTVETPHAIRSFNLVIPLIWFIAIGTVSVLTKLNKKNIRYVLALLAFLFTANAGFYLHMYHAHMPREHSSYWQYGYKELINYLENNKKNYQEVVFYSNGGTILNKAHGFVLFYTYYDPEKYQQQGGTKLCHFGFSGRYHYDHFWFRTIKCFEEQPLIDVEQDYLTFPENTVFVAVPEDVPGSAKIVKQVYDFYNRPVLTVFIQKPE